MKILLFFFISFNVMAFDHQFTHWDEFLKHSVIRREYQTLVRYHQIDADKLNTITRNFSQLTAAEFKSFTKKQQLSFLINAYNAFTIKLVKDHYPIQSIKDLGGIFSSVWKKKFILLLGKEVHLDEIEHVMIRENFQEPRIHFALNCASMGCPSLLIEAFVFSKLEEQLEKTAHNFMSNAKKNYFDQSKNIFHLSKIFDWYGDDFKTRYGSYMNFVKRFYPINDKTKIEFLSYDWNLNDAK